MFDWQEYLDLAADLVAHPPDRAEARHRAAASRAYYAAFHRSRQMIERELGRALDHQRSIHAEVIRRLCERPARERVGRTLDRLRAKRVHADYKDQREFFLRDAELALKLARRVVSGLR